MPHLTREQAREVDRLAMEELGIPGIVLMENAAIGITRVVRRRHEGGEVAIVCGPGNNGGDGFAAGRHLANAGLPVRFHMVVPAAAYPDGSDAGINLAIVRAMGLPLREDLDLEGAGLLLDAVFGTGLSRDARDPYRAAILAINEAPCPVVAVDVPSGLDANTGAVLGAAVQADVTATMVAPKVGFFCGEGPGLVGEVEVVGIGIPPALVERVAKGGA